jgi:hypothetical protein
VALCSPLSDFSFQLSAFQLLPKGGLGVALGGFAQPPFWFQLSAFQHFSFCQSVALCSPLSDFSFQHFSFSAFAEMWLWVAPPGLSMLEVGCWMFDVRC